MAECATKDSHEPGQARPSANSGLLTAGQYPIEWKRIGLLCARDGVPAAIEFCRRTSHIYRTAVLTSSRRGHGHPHFASLPEYRARFIGSYLDFKRFHLAYDRSPARERLPGPEAKSE